MSNIVLKILAIIHQKLNNFTLKRPFVTQGKQIAEWSNCRVIKKQTEKMTQDYDKEFLEYVVKALVDNPNDVSVDRKVDEMGVLLSLKVNPADMGQIIGREGSTAKAIRNLVRIVGLKKKERVNLKIEEPEGGRAPRAEKREMSDDIENISL